MPYWPFSLRYLHAQRSLGRPAAPRLLPFATRDTCVADLWGRGRGYLKTRKYTKSAFRTNFGPISMWVFYIIFVKFGIVGWIRNGHDITNALGNCKFHLFFDFAFFSNNCYTYDM